MITEEDEASIRHMKEGEYKILHHREPPEIVHRTKDYTIGIPIHWSNEDMLKQAHDRINELIKLACKKRDKKGLPTFDWKKIQSVFEQMDRIPSMIELQLAKDEIYKPLTMVKQ